MTIMMRNKPVWRRSNQGRRGLEVVVTTSVYQRTQAATWYFPSIYGYVSSVFMRTSWSQDWSHGPAIALDVVVGPYRGE